MPANWDQCTPEERERGYKPGNKKPVALIMVIAIVVIGLFILKNI